MAISSNRTNRFAGSIWNVAAAALDAQKSTLTAEVLQAAIVAFYQQADIDWDQFLRDFTDIFQKGLKGEEDTKQEAEYICGEEIVIKWDR